MAHARNESVTAASLFGNEPPSNDFFASLAGEEQPPREMDQDRHFSPKGLATTHSSTANDASDLFANSTTGNDVDSWNLGDSSHGGIEAAKVDVAHETPSYQYGSHEPAASQEDPYASQGWYDEYGQWNVYETYQQDQGHPAWTPHQDPTYDQTAQDSAYGNGTYDYGNSNYNQSETGAVNYATSTPAALGHYATTVSPQSYDPYRPAASQVHPPATHTSSTPISTNYNANAHTSTFTSSQQLYDPYKPSTTAVASPAIQPGTATYASQSYSYTTPQPSVIPKPPQPLAGINRATSYNAYDPPVLDKPRKGSRIVSASAAPFSPPSSLYPAFVGQQVQAPVAPHLPPPPPRSPYYGHSAQPTTAVYQQTAVVPPPVDPAFAARAQSPPRSTYDPYAPNGVNAHTPPRASQRHSSHPPANPAPSSMYGTSQDVNWNPTYSSTAQQAPPALSWTANAYQTAGDSDASHQQHVMARSPHSGDTVTAWDGPGAGNYQSHAVPVSARSGTHLQSDISLSSPQLSRSALPETSAVHSRPSSLNGMSPKSPPQPPPSKPPQRNATPGSARNYAGSPDYSARSSLEQMRGSPRPDYQGASVYPSTTSSPAAHLEMARSRIASPEAGAKSIQKTVTTNGVLPRGDHDPYSPVRAGSLPTNVDVVGGVPRAASPYGGDPPSQYDPYSPQAQTAHRRQTTSGSDYVPERKMTYDGYSNGNTNVYDAPRASIDSTRSLHSAYTPSTDQTGGDDFLGRISSRAPIIAFGFGGKVVSVFPKQADSTAGFDVSLISKKPPPISIRPLKQFMNTDGIVFPGPLFADPGTPTVNITRTAAATVKANKIAVLKYLNARAEIVEKEIGQLPGLERPKASGKLALILLLKIMVDHDGKLSGSPEIEQQVRAALVPRLKESSDGSPAYGFSGGGNLLVPGQILMHAQGNSTLPRATGMSSEGLSDALDTIQEYLLRGEKKAAYRHALDHRLWAHALVIASSVDKQSWKEAVDEFIRTDLAVNANGAEAQPVNGRETMRVAYSMFAGYAYASVQELLPPKPLTATLSSGTSVPMPVSPLPPSTPNHSQVGPAAMALPASAEALAQWPETAATILANATNGDAAALTGLGDLLMANKWPSAAYACYLLAPQTSLMTGAGAPSAKMILVGSENPQRKATFHTESDPFIFSEILEFAYSLAPVTKGQEGFTGIPHLQAYRLIYASQLAEMGEVSLASRYCEAISLVSRSSKPSTFYTATFQHQLRDFSDRLSGTPQLDKSGSWIARKVAKPSLATIGNWIEGSVSKFIAGEGDESSKDANVTESKRENSTAAHGPFAQFTVISSANTSPNSSSANLVGSVGPPSSTLAPPAPQTVPRRSGSALAVRPTLSAFTPTDRSVSAMEVRPETRPSYDYGAYAYSANAVTTSFSHAETADKPGARSQSEAGDVSETTESNRGWWDYSSSTNDESTAATTPTFHNVSTIDDSSNFTSSMENVDAFYTSRTASHSSTPRSMSVHPIEEDLEAEDLGFGNSSHKKSAKANVDDTSSSTKPSKSPASLSDTSSPKTVSSSQDKPASGADGQAGGSWLPWRWGKKGEAPTSGPVRAKLGEESSFVYDKDLKRWVNKKAGDTATAASAPLPPPPSRAPSRAQTVSPGAGIVPSTLARGATPPPRPQSSVPVSQNMPPKRSQLAASFVPEAPPIRPSPRPPALSMSKVDDPDLVPPPLSSRSSAAAKRKGKSRYVDVFQQEQ